MRKQIVLILLVIPGFANGQHRALDTRAELEINGRINEISISQEDKIWLTTATGNLYYTNSIDSNWHYGKILFKKDSNKIFNLSRAGFDRISFFNKDTAIITGYIKNNTGSTTNGGYYYTNDGGKSLKLLNYGGDSWIYDVFVGDNGKVWMGGSSGKIYYSDNYGEKWQELNSPYNSSSRMHSIFMQNKNEGVSGALHNKICVTSNNWKTFKEIPSPYSQNKYKNREDYSDDRIEKVLIWGDYLVVNQNGHIYYSDKNKINWKPFTQPIVDFELDEESQQLYAITDELKVISFSSTTSFVSLSSQSLTAYPSDIKVMNDGLFILTQNNEVFRADIKGIKYSRLYTIDKKIARPRVVVQNEKRTWGANRDQLYVSNDEGANWYRENVMNFSISDILSINENTVILWDGEGTNYLYTYQTESSKKHSLVNPLSVFLNSSVQSLSISAGSSGCFHGNEDKVSYKLKDDSALITTKFDKKKRSVSPSMAKFSNQVNSLNLIKALESINSSPSKIPSILDFNISDEDLIQYKILVEKRFENEADKNKEAFYYNIPNILDTLNQEIINKIFNHREMFWSTSSSWFNIELINKNNDTIMVSRSYFNNSLPMNFPWEFEFKGQHFYCYNVNFSKFIGLCIPKEFSDKKLFNSSYFILEIANYLYSKQS